MIRNPGRRMTVAHLKERMDQRFKEVDRKLDSIGDKLDSIANRLDGKTDGHFKILGEHEDRIQDLETWRRAKEDPPG
jgi:hypothetical protein